MRLHLKLPLVFAVFLGLFSPAFAANDQAREAYYEGIKARDANDYQRSHSLLCVAAKAEYPDAVMECGMTYLLGAGVARNVQNGILLLARAAELKVGAAAFRLSLLYLKGEVVQRDLAKAKTYLLQGANLGSGEAEYALANAYMRGMTVDGVVVFAKDVVQAAIWMEKAASYSMQSSFDYGIVLYQGIGRPSDKMEGLKWIEMSIGMGGMKAADVLTKIYRTDAEVKALYDEQGLQMVQQHEAGEGGRIYDVVGPGFGRAPPAGMVMVDPTFYFRLGLRAAYGLGVSGGPVAAVKYWQHDIDSNVGFSGSMFLLGMAYYTGTGVVEDKVKGIALLQRLNMGSHEGAAAFLRSIKAPLKPPK